MIPTIEEYLTDCDCFQYPDSGLWSFVSKADIKEIIEMHVKQAIIQTLESVKLEAYCSDCFIDKDSIINAYPLENIK